MKTKKISLLLLSVITMLLTACGGSSGPKEGYLNISTNDTNPIKISEASRGFAFKLTASSEFDSYTVSSIKFNSSIDGVTFEQTNDGTTISGSEWKAVPSKVGEYTIYAYCGSIESNKLSFTVVDSKFPMSCAMPNGYQVQYELAEHDVAYSQTRVVSKVDDSYMLSTPRRYEFGKYDIINFYKKQNDGKYLVYNGDTPTEERVTEDVVLSRVFDVLYPDPDLSNTEFTTIKTEDVGTASGQWFRNCKIVTYNNFKGSGKNIEVDYYTEFEFKLSIKTVYSGTTERNVWVTGIKPVTSHPTDAPSL